ncbi:hypothetical protein [Arthrobacter sp. D3-16]
MSRDGALGVCTALAAYTAAVAELPCSAALTEDMRGAVVVVPGSGDWWQGMLAARAGGASAVVLADPAMLQQNAFASHPWPGGIPVVVERPSLRPDVAADAVRARGGSSARLVTVECAGPVAGLDGVILDGFGWARSLAGAPLTLSAGISTPQGRMALLGPEGAGSAPATVLGIPLGGLHGGGLLHVLALGEVRTEVTVDQPAGLTRVETFTEDGALRAPERYESSARLALRRALDACLSGKQEGDLDGLLQDMALAWALRDA